MRTFVAFLILSAVVMTPTYAAEKTHSQHSAAPPLTSSGNDAFAAIKEIVDKLMADPETAWDRIDLEALRKHLVDMQNITLNVAVESQKPIDAGIEFMVKPATPDAAASLDRLFPAHAEMLKQEVGWEMRTTKGKGGYTVRVTSAKAEDVPKIRGLGYIGIVTMGQHHQPHHWRMATGADPHAGH